MAKTAKAGKGTKLYFLILFILCSITGWLVFKYLNAQRQTVFLFADNYQEGTMLSGEMLVSSEMDVSTYNIAALQGSKYATMDDVRMFIENGEVLSVPVAKGTPMTVSQTLAGGGTALENRLGKYMASVELDPTLVSGLNVELNVGSRINLISTFASETSADDVTTKYAEYAFQNLLVIGLRTDGAGTTLGVSVEIDPVEALRLVHAMNNEKLTAVVLKPGSYVPVHSAEASYAKKYTEDPTTRTYDTGHGVNVVPQEELPLDNETENVGTGQEGGIVGAPAEQDMPSAPVEETTATE